MRWAESGDAQLAAQLAGRPVLLGFILPFEDRKTVPVSLAQAFHLTQVLHILPNGASASWGTPASAAYPSGSTRLLVLIYLRSVGMQGHDVERCGSTRRSFGDRCRSLSLGIGVVPTLNRHLNGYASSIFLS